ncbi:hypothetical protein OL383_004429 [Salmonella enterica]|nr:hypothetical protein [Salmonella enterica]
MNKDMFIDTDTFNFFDLADITYEERAEFAPVEQPTKFDGVTADEIGPDGGIADDASDLFDNDEERELEAEEAADPNNNTSDLQTETDPEETLDIFNDLPDDAPINFAGRSMTKAQVAEAVEMIDRVKAESEIVSDAAKNIDQINRYLIQQHHRSATAIDHNIQVIQQQMNSGVSDVEYGNLSRKLQQAIEARQVLDAATDEKMRALDVEKAEIARFRINQEISTLSKTIPDWENRRKQVLSYALEKKVNLNDVEKVWSPELAEMMYKAYCYDKTREKAKTTALERAKAKAPRSQSSTANAQRTNAANQQEQRLNHLKQKMNKGGLDERETADMFQFLKD